MKKKLINGVSIIVVIVALIIPTIKMAHATVVECPGGSCSYTEYVWFHPVWTCTVCCQSGQTPSCNTTGCSCLIN